MNSGIVIYITPLRNLCDMRILFKEEKMKVRKSLLVCVFALVLVLALTACSDDNTPLEHQHTVVIDEAVESTCNKTGLTEGSHCSECGEILIAQSEVSLKAHIYDDKYDAFCNVCGYERDAECAHVELETIPGKAATCKEEGLTDGKRCAKCGEVIVAQQIIPANEHIYDSKLTPPTDTEDGYITYTCQCGDSYTEIIVPTAFTVTDSNRELIGYTGQVAENLVIPAVFENNGTWYRVTSIGWGAFFDCGSLISIVIPDSVTSIDVFAFCECRSLTCVVIPDSVMSIGERAFYNCRSLTSIVIPDSVTSIGYGAFYNCSSLTSIVIPDSVTSIGDQAFYNCSNLKSIVIPDGLTSIGSYAFSGCNTLKSVVIPDSVTSIGNYAFDRCSSLTSIVLPDSVTSIGHDAFTYCSSLTSIVIPDSVMRIGTYTFHGCSSLASIVIPDSVTRIDDYVFLYCSSLTSITFKGTIAQWNAVSKGSGWNSYTGNYTIYCTDGSIAKDGTVTYN